jgi:cytochrome c nitrite reductase small subunit
MAGAMALCAALLGFFLLFGPPRLLAKSESPAFCASCHVMKPQYAAYMHNGAHRRLKCVECHLPNDNLASHYIWKSIDGMKDVVVFNTNTVPERIEISEHGAAVVKANCIRCHHALVSQMDTSRNCWSCHRRMTHTGTGALQTL